MRTKKGQVLLHVIIMSVVMISICTAITKYALQLRISQKKTVVKDEVFSELEGVNARIWACLNDVGYPEAGTCRPTVTARACVPAGVTPTFRGTYPECHILLSVDK